MLRIYRALVRSKLDYGSIVYDSARESYIKTLNAVHNGGVRLSTGAFRSSPVISIAAECGEPPLNIRRKRNIVSYASKLRSQPDHPTYNCVFNPRFSSLYLRRRNATRPLGIRLTNLLNELQIVLPRTLRVGRNSVPPWLIPRPSIDISLSIHPRSTTTPELYRQLFLAMLDQNRDFHPIYTDGSKSNDRVGCAFVIDNDNFGFKLSQECSIFTAELFAILQALRHVHGPNKYVVCSDSLSALQAMQCPYSSHPLICLIHDKLYSLQRGGTTIRFYWVPGHVGIAGNELADTAAKDAVNNGQDVFCVIGDDLKNGLVTAVQQLWKDEWSAVNENKLRALKPTVDPWLTSCRPSRWEEVVLARLRIGHCRLTHGFLMAREEPPFCETCDTRVTVSHFLIECVQFRDTRQQIGLSGDLSVVLGNDPDNVGLLFTFLKETGLDRFV